jgi:hypothetical protein
VPPALEIEDNPKLFPYFDSCLGALDGTHIHAFVEDSLRPHYRNWKGDVTQNVLAVCTFDMKFLYAITGWEGSVSDSYMYEEARSGTFTIPANKFYLGDAGFPLCDHLLVPYHRVRYHLREWGAVRKRYMSSYLMHVRKGSQPFIDPRTTKRSSTSVIPKPAM